MAGCAETDRPLSVIKHYESYAEGTLLDLLGEDALDKLLSADQEDANAILRTSSLEPLLRGASGNKIFDELLSDNTFWLQNKEGRLARLVSMDVGLLEPCYQGTGPQAHSHHAAGEAHLAPNTPCNTPMSVVATPSHDTASRKRNREAMEGDSVCLSSDMPDDSTQKHGVEWTEDGPPQRVLKTRNLNELAQLPPSSMLPRQYPEGACEPPLRSALGSSGALDRCAADQRTWTHDSPSCQPSQILTQGMQGQDAADPYQPSAAEIHVTHPRGALRVNTEKPLRARGGSAAPEGPPADAAPTSRSPQLEAPHPREHRNSAPGQLQDLPQELPLQQQGPARWAPSGSTVRYDAPQGSSRSAFEVPSRSDGYGASPHISTSNPPEVYPLGQEGDGYAALAHGREQERYGGGLAAAHQVERYRAEPERGRFGGEEQYYGDENFNGAYGWDERTAWEQAAYTAAERTARSYSAPLPPAAGREQARGHRAANGRDRGEAPQAQALQPQQNSYYEEENTYMDSSRYAAMDRAHSAQAPRPGRYGQQPAHRGAAVQRGSPADIYGHQNRAGPPQPRRNSRDGYGDSSPAMGDNDPPRSMRDPAGELQEELSRLQAENRLLQRELGNLTDEIQSVEKENRVMKMVMVHLAQRGNFHTPAPAPVPQQQQPAAPPPQPRRRAAPPPQLAPAAPAPAVQSVTDQQAAQIAGAVLRASKGDPMVALQQLLEAAVGKLRGAK